MDHLQQALEWLALKVERDVHPNYDTLAEHIAALTAELEALRRDAEKWRAWKASQDRIEKELPEGYAIELWCSPGDWSISLRDPEGKDIEIVDFDDVDDFIRRAIEVARQTVALVPVSVKEAG